MRFRSGLQLAGCCVALMFLFGCGGTGSENAPAEQAQTEAKTEKPSMEQVGAAMDEMDHKHVEGAAVCPVSGHDIDPATAVTVTYEGHEIQLCCQDCVAPFNQDPAKYMASLEKPAEAGEPASH